MKKYLFLALTMILMLSACSAMSGATSETLVGSWKLISYGPAASPTPAVAGTEATLTFNGDGTMTGNAGCNGFGGKYKTDGDDVTFSEVVSTLMACDAPRMEQEGIVHQVLNGTSTFKMEGNALTINNQDTVLVFSRASYP